MLEENQKTKTEKNEFQDSADRYQQINSSLNEENESLKTAAGHLLDLNDVLQKEKESMEKAY